MSSSLPVIPTNYMLEEEEALFGEVEEMAN